MKKTVIRIAAAILLCGMLAGCGGETPSSVSGEMSALTSEASAAPTDETATPGESGEPTEAETEGPAPIDGGRIADGVYAIEVSSSSSMFRIVDAQLTVEGDAMTAVLTLSGTGYEKLYMGTGEDALADTDDQCIYYEENSEGQYTYTVPVAALNQETDVAAWSIRKESWYDRVLVFRSAGIPDSAIIAEAQ